MKRLLPEVLAESATPAGARLELRVAPDLAHFEGHFPGLPILPGVVQLHWAERFARERFGHMGEFCAIENLRFQSIVLPDTRLTLTLERDAATPRVRFSYVAGERKCSTGTIVYASP